MKRNEVFIPLILLVVLVGLTVGCTKKAIVRQYYVIDFPVKIDSTSSLPPLTQKICEIVPVRVAPVYTTNKIALRTRSHELTYFLYHVWAVKPDKAITHLMEKFFQAQHLFKEISSYLWKTQPDYELRTRVDRLELSEQKGRMFARVAMTLELYDLKTNQTVVYHVFDSSLPLQKKNINLFAAVVSSEIHHQLKEMATKMKLYLTHDKTTTVP
ncbi:MAG: hypothetical protein D6748_03820 [Calditrichaeota bacterium]|nr:MAG: hypothetical protein D6748_03820 [Calditrichota bacterium]